MTERERPDEPGPVPVRDLLKQVSEQSPEAGKPEATSPAGGEAGPPEAAAPAAVEFEMGGAVWEARPAGAGAYGTGGRGRARLLAVHFYLAAEPDRPVREALVPAAAFAYLRASELVELYERATPIDLDRGGT